MMGLSAISEWWPRGQCHMDIEYKGGARGATALRIATQNGANYVLREDQLGSIEPGKLADLLVIDSDYMKMPEEDISEIQVLVTMIGGKVMFLHSDFSREYNFTPEGAVIGTLESLRERQ